MFVPAVWIAGLPQPAAQVRTPQAVLDELLAADRAFSQASEKTDLVSGLASMFADDIVMLAPGKLARGKADVLATLRGNPANATSRARWNPVRGGISADGLHGFTFGHMVTTGTDGAATPGKYLSYWIKGPAGWRVVAYKRSRAPEGMKISAETMPPALPERLVAPQTEPKLLSAYRESLASAERDFSDDAQKIGIGAAFARHGSADAINLGGPTVNGFLVGSDAIGRAIGEGEPTDSSALSWGPDSVVVASSGDLGLSVGTIRRNTPPADPSQPSTFPFFTIWRRSSASDPWKYIAE